MAVPGRAEVDLHDAATGQGVEGVQHQVEQELLQLVLVRLHPDRRPLDLTDVVGRVFAVVKGRAKKQRVDLRLLPPGAPARVEADRDQLQQLLLNLVLNALDAMPGGGAVEVDLRPPADGFAELYVRDTGPGIAPHVLPKIFETFVSSKETGVGLGLPVSRRIAEDHGGSLSAYNLPGGGACFLLRLPAPGSA